MQRVEKLYRRERSALLGFIRSRTANTEEAEDLLQEVFLQALRNANAAEPIENILGWLYTVARNRIIDLYRRRRRTVSLQQETEADTIESLLEDYGIDIEKEFIRSAVMEALTEALAELPAGQREAFVQQAVEGRTFREISEESGMPLNTLIARKHYAVRFLRRRLAELREVLHELA